MWQSHKSYHKLVDKVQGEIKYDYEQFGTDDVMLQRHSPGAYCLKMCNKIGYYLQQIHAIEIIRMQVEFQQDETGKVVFFNCKNLWVRELEEMKPKEPKTRFEERSESWRDMPVKQRDKSAVTAIQLKNLLSAFTKDVLTFIRSGGQNDNLLEIMQDYNEKLVIMQTEDNKDAIKHCKYNQKKADQAKAAEIQQKVEDSLQKDVEKQKSRNINVTVK